LQQIEKTLSLVSAVYCTYSKPH